MSRLSPHIGALWFALVFVFQAQAQMPADDLQKVVVSVDTPSPILADAQKVLTESLKELNPRAKAAPKSLTTRSGLAVLYGDLFKTGGCFALTEVPVKSEDEPQYNNVRVALAEWISGKWRIRGLWNIPPVWRPKGWKRADDDALPITPTTQPFELRDFNGDGVPEVIIAGEVDKYYQAYYLLRFESETRGLVLLAEAMGKPELAGKYVRLYFNSGQRAIFEEWKYLSWAGTNLAVKASWHAEVPYNNEDPEFIRAEITAEDGHPRQFRITSAESDSEKESAYTITRDDLPYAKVVIVWPESRIKKPVADADEIERAWLFEKISGLSRDLYPRRRDIKHLTRLESHATVRVAGDEEAAKQFSISKR